MKPFAAAFLSLIVSAAAAVAAQTPYSGTPVQLPGIIQAENYDSGGEGVAWHDTTPGNAFGVYRADDMDVGPIAAGGYHIGALNDGEWAEYTVNIPTAGNYNLTIRYSSAYPGTTTFRILLDGAVILGSQTLDATGDWQTYVPRTFPVTLAAGSNRVLRIAFDVGAFNLDRITVATPSCTMPSITLHPRSVNPEAGNTVVLKGTATGSPAPAYKWFKNGTPVTTGVKTPPDDLSAGSVLELTNVEHAKDIGNYTFEATNTCGTIRSNVAAIARVLCGGPDNGIENLRRILNPALGLGDRCDWTKNVSTTFPDTFGGGKGYNEPVIAAAMAFLKEPIRANVWNMDEWWPKYLRGELGDRGTEWYYGGEELGSYNYQKYNISSVLAVHFHANRTGKIVIRDLARRWLRATFALHALAAMPNRPSTLHAKGQTELVAAGYVGPYVAMAGDRSSWGFWMDVNRMVPFAVAVGLPTNADGEQPYHRGVRTAVESWAGVYGFNATEQAELRRIVTEGILPPNFIGNYLGTGLRAKHAYHFVGWADAKATLMEDFANPNTVPTLGVAYFTAPKFSGGREVHLLYPWEGLWRRDGNTLHRHGICHGWSLLDLPNRRMEAGHPDCTVYDPATDQTRVVHPAQTVSVEGLPVSRLYHLVLTPTAPPALR